MAKGKGGDGQQEIPGVLPEVVKIPALTKAVKKLSGMRSELAKMRLDMRDEKIRIAQKMHENNLTEYKAGNLIVSLKVGEEKILIKDAVDGEDDEIDIEKLGDD